MPTLKELIIQLEQGSYVIPEIQRGFVWKNNDVKELFNSILSGLPIGSIVVWEMVPGFVNENRDLFVPLIDELKDKLLNGKYLVIDGQQRLISLLLAKYGKITKMNKRRQITLYYCLDLRENKTEFTLEMERGWDYCFTSRELLTYDNPYDILEKHGITDPKLIRMLNDTIIKLFRYPVHLLTIEQEVFKPFVDSGDYIGFLEKLSDMFVKLNMQGHRVKMPELVVAILDPATRAKFGQAFRDKINEIDSEFDQLGWDIDEAVYLRLLLAITTGSARFREAKAKLREIKGDELREGLDYMRASLRRAIESLGRLNIKNQDYLSSRYQLVTLGYYFHISIKERTIVNLADIKTWLILSAINRRYTGRLETDLHEDISRLRDEKDIKKVIANYSIRKVNTDYFNRPIRRDLLQILLILLSEADDFPVEPSRLPDKLMDIRTLHMHHIFPKKPLKRFLERTYGTDGSIVLEIDGSKLEMDIEEACDHLGNITFISIKANESIQDKSPLDYLARIPEDIRRKHFIPLDEDLYREENYVEFLVERIKLIERAANTALS